MLVIQQFSGFCNIGESTRHVPWNRCAKFDGRLAPKRFLDFADHREQIDRFIFTQIKDIERCTLEIDRTEDTLDDIIDISKITSSRTVAVHFDGLIVRDQMSEPIYRKIGTLARTVDGEEPEADNLESVEVRIV